MKHQLIPRRKTLLLAAMATFFLLFPACQNDTDGPSFSCPEMKMTATIAGRSSAMTLTNSIIFRSITDSGSHKLLNMETISDTFKIVFNLTDGMFDENAIKNDSLHLDTFRFSRLGPQKKGLVAAAFLNNNGNFDFLTTDTSNIIIRKINTRAQTISGSFFFMANDRTITGGGSFENACYVSLQ
ncbi:hypothetical protein [Chitinophaga sp. RAB17]|uniref:hypothetical protein n=1 Tax=Chitinophaga sp. RAB17 TaxID=3233049 RepID=UPI003F8FB765